MTIKYLVIAGGGPVGIKSLGSLSYLHDCGFWNISDIVSIYATSAGVLLSVLILLKFDFATIIDYIINRPWHETYTIHLSEIYDMYLKKGFLDEDSVEIFFKPFFNSKDINFKTITMQEFFEYSNIDLHIFTFEINEFKIIDISHTTFPNLLLKTAIKMSISIPILFTPLCIEDKCYIDGGLMCNYPIQYCLEKVGNENQHEVLGLRNDYITQNNSVTQSSNIFELFFVFIDKLLIYLNSEVKYPAISNEIVHLSQSGKIKSVLDALYSSQSRLELLNDGIKNAEIFYTNVVVKNCSKLSAVTFAS